jgi:hypothetical protein
MAQRKVSPVFNKGSLALNKVVGVRPDNTNEFIKAPLKKDTTFRLAQPSMKSVANTTTDGFKK